jgi:transposase
MKKPHVQLSSADREKLETLVSQGQQAAKVYRRALALLELDRGKTYTAVAETVGVCRQTLTQLSACYQEQGLQCLYDAARSGRPLEIDGTQRAAITALACSTPPTGHTRWSLRLLAAKAVELDLCETLSHTEAGLILKKTTCTPI